MRTARTRLPSPALIISVIALVVALGGTSYAALNSLPKNSVGTKQLKNNAVTTSKIANGAVTRGKIANGAVTGGKVKLSTLGTVPSASTAKNALALGGAPPSAYLKGTVTVVAKSANISPGKYGTAIATCPAGYQAIGGGVDPFNVLSDDVTASAPMFNGSRTLGANVGNGPAANAWWGAVANNGAGATDHFQVAAICAPTG
ncbi:MAG: hypothetical protein M3018_10785 [Actinomycetota bacterium]|nr:hypothetical protein [Actinomycetota bacterium]